MEGKIKRLMHERGYGGYGFITAEDGTDVFFHRSALQGIRFATLKEGDRVKFDLERDNRGPRAANVSLIRG